MTLSKPQASAIFVDTLSDFVSKAEAFLQDYYHSGSDSESVEGMIKAVNDLRLDVDAAALEEEYEIKRERSDLNNDLDWSDWF